MILVSNWEKVDKDDFYLSDNWKGEEKEKKEEAKALQEKDNLYLAYIVIAKSYALYSQMDAEQVFINSDGDVILHFPGESVVIDNKHDYKIEID